MHCTKLTSLVIPASVTSICLGVFDNCTSLESIAVADDNKKYASRDGILYNKTFTEIIKVPQTKTSVTISERVTSIYHSAFSGCTKLSSITIPTSVAYIGYEVFKGCKIVNATVPCWTLREIPKTYLLTCKINGGNFIEEEEFSNCASLTSISIPTSVDFIGEKAFENCQNITIYCAAEKKPKAWDKDWNIIGGKFFKKRAKVIWNYKL